MEIRENLQKSRLLLFDGNKKKMTRKPGKKQKENPLRCTGEGKSLKGNIREGSRKGKTGTVLEVRWPLLGWLSQVGEFFLVREIREFGRKSQKVRKFCKFLIGNPCSLISVLWVALVFMWYWLLFF